MVKEIKKHFVLIIVLFLLFNCAKPVDFSQTEDLVLEPVIESSLLFYKASASDFFIGGRELNTTEDFAEIDFLSNSYVEENLVKVEFVFEIENSINRAYQLSIFFVNASGETLETFDVNTRPSRNNTITASEHIEIFEGEALQRIKQTRFIIFRLTMLPGEPVNGSTPGEISVKSKSILFLNID